MSSILRCEPGLTAELEAAHRQLSESDWRFRRLARRRPEWCRRASFDHVIRSEPEMIRDWVIQPWPAFVRRGLIAELERVSGGMSELLRRIPERVFGGDLAALERFYGLGGEVRAKDLFEPPNGLDLAVGRGDFILGASGFQCIELNLVAGLGGLDADLLARLHRENPLTAEMLDELGVEPETTPTLPTLFAHAVTEARRAGLPTNGTVRAAAVFRSGIAPEEREAFRRYLDEHLAAAAAVEGLDGRFTVCDHQDLRVSWRRRLYARGERAHLYFRINNGAVDRPAFRCFKAGRLHLYNTPGCLLLSDKRGLALLSDDSYGGRFSDQERAFLRAHLPWTRVVRRGETSFRGERVSLPELLASRRDELVLKSGRQCGGRDVYAGRFTSAAEWRQVIERALSEGHWVAQEHVQSQPYLFQSGEEGCAPHHMVWGPFLFGRRYGGVILRVQPVADRTIINLSLTATEAIVFEVEE